MSEVQPRMEAAPESASTLSRDLTQTDRLNRTEGFMEPTSPHHPDNWNRINVPPRVAERAATNVDVDENGCWISRYSRSRNGYSQIGWSEQGERHMVT